MRTRLQVVFGILLIGVSLSWASSADADPEGVSALKIVSPKVESEIKSIFIGHNATPTTYALPAHTITIGNYGVGYSPSDTTLIATSPWIWTSYNTANIVGKWAKPVSDRWRIGAFAAYFRSVEDRPLIKDGALQRYQFETAALQALASYQWHRTIVHAGLKYSYFINDDRPYSLRMDPGDESIRDQLDLTMLVEQKISEKMRLNFEFGILALTALRPYGHVGISWCVLLDSWLLQLGASYTAQWASVGTDQFWTPGTGNNRWKSNSDGQLYTGYMVTALHPEIQIQYFF